eukprot:XP_017944862.1 PREDICTED: vomeronasal type-2 receptor 26-like [Xenopus tropicalis]
MTWFSFQYYRHLLVFKFAIEEINRSSWILPNVTLGYQVSYGATDPVYNDRIQFPSFYRTVPNELSEMDGIVQILKHFGWKWVGLIVSNSDSGGRALDKIKKVQKCSGNESLDDEALSRFGNFDFRVGYQVYTAVYALAHSLHNLFSARAPAHPQAPAGSLKHRFKPWQLNAFILNVTYKTSSGDIMFFKDNGDPPAQFDIFKWLFLNDDSVVSRKVGRFDESKDKNHFYINSSADLWSPYFTEVTSFNAVTCVKCPEDQKSNRQKTDCVPKALNYLSYMDTLGASLASTAIILFITTSVVLGIFVKYWETPIVRASNQHLSCLLLISLMLCFLCTLLFIGRPTQICCLLRQVTFGVVFTISVSSVLAKTLTVIIAFNATKPGSKLKKYVGTQLSIILVIVCFLGVTLICIIWMASSPPFPDADTSSETDTIILLCNEGSVTFFFCIIGYIGTLALLSFIAAFLAKDFPDRFNEAKNITFSMLGFCSVWGAFVPAYLSSKGSRMVAVEIFAILSSSAGLLICIFAPKCFIIFLRPELNIREMVGRKA